jgi:hypothetical protein
MTQDETPKVAKWLRDRKSSAWRRVITIRDQLRQTPRDGWEYDRHLKWLKEAQIEYAWLSHWITLT